MTIDKNIVRIFTKEIEDKDMTVYDMFKWKSVDVVIKNYSTGKTITDMKGLEFPENYSQSACDIIASKYFRKRGVGGEKDYEYSMKQIAHRMVTFWVSSMIDSGLISDDKKQIIYDELVYTLLDQRFAPNSPQWFNTGLNLYGITGSSQGHYYFNEEQNKVVLSKDAYTRTQGSACFITSVDDALLGNKSLTNQITTETLLFKYGSGVGSNWSTIRAKDEHLSGGGKSSGLLSFLKVSDRNAGAIKSGGTTRRAAKMNILDLDHPEILDYINWKSIEEDKVVALGKMGYSTSIEGEAYDTVSGQNANNSVRITNEFMKSLNTLGAIWQTYGRVDNSVNHSIPSQKLWDDIAYAAWRCGDPGVQYDDIINAWHTCPAGEDGKFGAKHNRINASNPCSEYMFLDDTACNLASINLMKYYDIENEIFDYKGYLHTIMLVQMALEATIHFGQFPTEDIARKSYMFRTTGLGFTNLGSLFMVMGLAYDSNEARVIASSLASIMTGHSYYTSALMAQKLGPFKSYENNKKYMLQVVKNHGAVAGYKKESNEQLVGLNYNPIYIDHSLLKNLKMSDMSKHVKLAWENAVKVGELHGFRNAQVTVLAPTGTIAFAMDCATTSSEPFFSHIAFKKLVGGSFMEIVNPLVGLGLRKLGYNQNQIQEIVDYIHRKEDGILVDGKIEGAPHLKSEHLCVFDTANKCGSGNRFIAPQGHVEMMGALSPHITGAISKTVNLPSQATVQEIQDIYLLSYNLGIKAIALFRDNCKASQPLNTTKASNEKNIEDYTYNELLKLVKSTPSIVSKPLRDKPKGIREARVHEAEINGIKYYIHTSYYNDDDITDSIKNNRKGIERTFNREDGRWLGEVYISAGEQGSMTKGLLDSLSKTISIMLQYGVPARDISSMYRGHKYEPSGHVKGHPYIKWVDSISDLISKVIDVELGNYTYCQVKPIDWEDKNQKISLSVFDVEQSLQFIQGELCSNCKSSKLVKAGICKVCTECGTTTGCS